MEIDLGNSIKDETQKLIESYSSLALIVSSRANVLAMNSRARIIADLLSNGTLTDLEDLIEASAKKQVITEGVVAATMGKGSFIWDVTVLPENTTGNLLILARDRTEDHAREAEFIREQNHGKIREYIFSSLWNELDPQQRLLNAAKTMVEVLGINGCCIYRQTKKGQDLVVAQCDSEEEKKALISKIPTIDHGAKPVTMNIGSLEVLSIATQYGQDANGCVAIWKSSEAEGWGDDQRTLFSEISSQVGIANEHLIKYERIVALSRTDSMTGLLNRRAFLAEELPRRVARLKRSGEPAALFYIDIDNFKLVNDAFGHRAGDNVIMSLREMLMDLSRPGDVLARMGGDEFAMWLDGVGADVAEARAQELIKRSTCMKNMSGAVDKLLGLSVGIATFLPDSGENLENLMGRADSAMYAVKRKGKGGFQMASAERDGKILIKT